MPVDRSTGTKVDPPAQKGSPSAPTGFPKTVAPLTALVGQPSWATWLLYSLVTSTAQGDK